MTLNTRILGVIHHEQARVLAWPICIPNLTRSMSSILSQHRTGSRNLNMPSLGRLSSAEEKKKQKTNKLAEVKTVKDFHGVSRISFWGYKFIYPVGNLSQLLFCPFEVQCMPILRYKSLGHAPVFHKFSINTQGDSDVISSYHIYASCFSATLQVKLCEVFLIRTSLSQ